jgi:opacity protein-like surface antigen
MKLNRILAAVAVPLGLSAVGPAHAQGVSVTDYKNATSAYEEAYLNGQFSMSKNRGDAQSAYDLNLGLNYDRVFSSPDRDLRIQGSAAGTSNRAPTAGAKRTSSYTYGAGVTADNYFTPGSSGAFWYGGLNLQGSSDFDSHQIAGTVGVGYGRVYNVTPMAKSIRIVEELIARGRMTRAPALATYQRVADVVDREPEFRSRYGPRDYEQYWVQAITEALTAGGTMAPDFGAADILKIYQIVTRERISTRKVGWKVRAGVGYIFRTFDGKSDNDPALEVVGEYYRPISNRLQFNEVATLNTILNSGDSSYTLRNDMSLTFEVDDRIDWENSWIFNYNRNGPTRTSSTINTLSTAFIYSLTNSLDATATFAVSKYSGDQTAGNPNGTDRSLFLGVRYRLR